VITAMLEGRLPASPISATLDFLLVHAAPGGSGTSSRPFASLVGRCTMRCANCCIIVE